ncbi:leucine Rich Repeat family protein [Aphelenchoides avenae]|nr:leucine Rich Repeat family protein [Aphelenchus avenae]
MDFDDANLAKTLECPVCLDVFDEPKLLNCGHTVCHTCVNKVVAAQPAWANASKERGQKCIKCPECNKETEIPPGGLATNYRLVGKWKLKAEIYFVCRAQKPLVDVCACSGCGEQASVTKMYTCETCQETLNTKPIWVCAGCALKQHRNHALSECNKATQQQIQETCQGIADSGGAVDTYIGLTLWHLGGAPEKTELIAQLLDQQKRGFARLEESVRSADNDLTLEDLAASLRAANDLKQKFEQASNFASEVGKIFESALRDFHEKLDDLFPVEQDEEPMEQEGSGTSRNNFDLVQYDDGQKVIRLSGRRIDAIPDLSRFTQLQTLGFRWNILSSINGNAIHATLKEMDLRSNQIAVIRGLDALVNLEILYIGYNRLKRIEGLTNLVKLKRIDLMHNKISKIEGLDTLVNLEQLDLDGNRIKAIEKLDSQHNLRELSLGQNRIRKIENLSHLTKLRVLDIKANRIRKLENLGALSHLEELHAGKQGIETFDGIQNLYELKLIDAGENPIASLDHLDDLQQLVELYLYENRISQWPELDMLAKLTKLRTVWLEGNPVETQDRNDYRRKVIQATTCSRRSPK